MKNTSIIINDNKTKSTSFTISQLSTLVRRHALLVSRDPTLYAGRAVMFFAMDFFFAIVYVNGRERTQEQVLNR